MATTVAQLMVRVGADTSEATQALGSLGTMLAKTGPLAIGGAIVAAAIVGIGVAAVHMAGDFQSGTAQLVTGAGLSANALGMVRQAILNMAVDTGTSTQQLTAGMYMISSAGFDASDALIILKAAAEGAKVGNADLGTVADAVTTVMKDYGLGANKAADATNLLVATVALGKTHMQDLADSISTVLPTASKFGVSLGDVMGAMATMTAHGIAAANAATYLRQMIVSLEAPTSAGVKALASVGLTSQEVADEIRNKGLPAALEMITTAIGKHFPAGSTAALDAFKNIAGGSRQMQGMLALTGTSAQMFATDAKKLGDQANSTTTQITGWNRIQNTFNQQLSRAKEAGEVLMIELGTRLLPVMTQLMNFIANGLIPTVQNFIHFITGTTAAANILRPVLVIVAIAIAGALVAAFIAWAVAAGAAAIATIAATWPVLAIGAAIALLIAGIILLVTHWQQVLTWLGNQTPIKMLIAGLGAVKDAVGWVIGKIGDLLGALGQLKNAAGNILGGIGHALGGIHIPGFASGGTMPDTGLAVVGERGPELLKLPGGTQITPGIDTIKGPPQNAAAFAMGGANSAQPLQSTFVIQLDGQKIAQSTMKHAPGIIRIATGIRSI